MLLLLRESTFGRQPCGSVPWLHDTSKVRELVTLMCPKRYQARMLVRTMVAQEPEGPDTTLGVRWDAPACHPDR